jgi:hypothetical protein
VQIASEALQPDGEETTYLSITATAFNVADLAGHSRQDIRVAAAVLAAACGPANNLIERERKFWKMKRG